MRDRERKEGNGRVGGKCKNEVEDGRGKGKRIKEKREIEKCTGKDTEKETGKKMRQIFSFTV